MAVYRLEQPLLDHRREPNAVDNGGVIELVGNDHVTWLTKRRKDRLVGIPTTRERVGRLNPVKVSDARFERVMALKRAADKADTRCTGAVTPQTGDTSFHDLRMVREAEVIV